MKVVQFDRPSENAPSPHQRELEFLRQSAEEARQGTHGRAVVLHGPHCAGVDALLTEWKRELHRRREHVFEGDCLPGAAVYAPLSEVVSRYVRAVEDHGLMDDDLQDLYVQVGRALGIPRLMALDAVAEARIEAGGQIRFYENLGRLLTELSRKLRGVIVLRDVHVADSATRAALTYLIENVITDPVGPFAPDGMQTAAFRGLMVVSVASESGMAATLRRSLSEREAVGFLNLRGATEETVRRFLTSPQVVQRFLDSSGGVPDNLEALLEGIPEKVQDLYLKRCEQLSEDEVEVLGALAVFGKPVGPDLLLRVLGRAPAPALVSGLFEKRIINRRVYGGQLLVDLPTEDNRRLVYERLNPILRADLHGRIAGLLEERARYGEPADLAELAHHYLRSGHREKAIEYGISAAERLHISYAYERAIEILEAVLPLLDGSPRRLEVLDRLIDLHACHSEHRRALFYCGLFKKALQPAERGPLYRRVGQMLHELGNYDSALRVLERARTLVESEDDGGFEPQDELNRIDAVAAEAYYGLGQYDRVVSVCQARLNKLVASPNPDAQRQVIRLTNALGKVHLFREDYQRAEHAFQENLKRAEEHNWAQEAVQARFNLGTIALQRRRYDKAEAVFSACLALEYAAQNSIIRAFCLMNLGVVYHKTHRYEQALDAYLHGLATFKKSGNDLQFAVVAMNLGSLYHTLGDQARARALVETSLEVTQLREIKFYQGWGRFVRGTISISEGRLDEAEIDLEAAHEIMESLGSASWVDRIRARQARLACERGRLDQCEQLLRDIRLDAVSRDAMETEAEGLLWLGQARARQGDRGAALAALVRAREIFEKIGHDERIWFADLVLAEHFLDDGRGGAAQRFLERARDRIEALEEGVPRPLLEAYRGQAHRKRVRALLEEARKSARRPARVAPRPIPLPQESEYDAWRARYGNIVGEDPKLLQIFRMIDRVADSDSTVLIQGDSGTGKELIAEAIHHNSARRDGPFVKVNCAAFVETLLLSELFGHEKGAFTGALTRKKGRFELAHGGTLFLDEIGDISPNTQVALLRVLQERTFERVGGSEPIGVDARVIVATNRNLEDMVKRDNFRLDLYYRLKGIIMELPPLCERRQDVVRLLHYFIEKHQPADRNQSFSRQAFEFLARYSWPGNVRELENFTRSITLFVDDETIDLAHILQFEEFFADGEMLDALPVDFFDALEKPADPIGPSESPERPRLVEISDDRGDAEPDGDPSEAAPTPIEDPGAAMLTWALQEGVGLPELRRRLETECIKRALCETGGNITRAAAILDMKRPRLSQIINATPELVSLKNELLSSER